MMNNGIAPRQACPESRRRMTRPTKRPIAKRCCRPCDLTRRICFTSEPRRVSDAAYNNDTNRIEDSSPRDPRGENLRNADATAVEEE